MKIQFEGISIKLEIDDVRALGLRKTGTSDDYELNFWRDTDPLKGEQSIITLNALPAMSFMLEDGALKINTVRQTSWPFGRHFAFVNDAGESSHFGSHAKFSDYGDGVDITIDWGFTPVGRMILLPGETIHLEARSGL